MNESVLIDAQIGYVNITIPEWTETEDSGHAERFQVHYFLEILDGAWRRVEKNPLARQFTVNGLKSHTTYQYRVILARTAYGNVLVSGPPGPSFNLTTACGGKRCLSSLRVNKIDEVISGNIIIIYFI